MSSGLTLVTPPRVEDASAYEYESADRSKRANISDQNLANPNLLSNECLKVKNFRELSTETCEKRSYSVSFHKNNESQSFRKRSDSYYRKRRYSFGTNGDQKHLNAKRRKDRIVLPTKFLLGGNITDPLNLSSLANSANQVTPQSSPLPTPKHKAQVEVLIPANINDPLNLYSNEDIDESCLISPKTKNKSRKRKRKRTDSETTVDHELEPNVALNPVNDDSVDTKKSSETHKHPKHRFNESIKSADKIVSPVIPQGSGSKHRRFGDHLKPSESEALNHKETKAFSKKSKKNKNKQKQSDYKFRTKDDRFRYGNYNRYYGYRNFHQKDCRLDSFKRDWFENKDVLDIGCNVGHITLFIAKNMRPNKIIGLDIDSDLIRMANKNVRHYITSNVLQSQDFPISLPLFHGPLASNGDTDFKFPQNVCFIAGNYISESEETLNIHKQQFDTILCLSLTKWVHLNWGDSGVKALFKRIFAQLRPNGRLILEAQPFCSYKRKKKINVSFSSRRPTLG